MATMRNRAPPPPLGPPCRCDIFRTSSAALTRPAAGSRYCGLPAHQALGGTAPDQLYSEPEPAAEAE